MIKLSRKTRKLRKRNLKMSQSKANKRNLLRKVSLLNSLGKINRKTKRRIPLRKMIPRNMIRNRDLKTMR